MLRFFDKISEASVRWYDSVSDRERRLLMVLFALLVVVLVASTIYFATSKIGSKRAELARNRSELSQILALEPDYLEAKAKSERAAQRIARNNVSLFTFIQGITGRFGISVTDLNEQKRPLPQSNLVETLVRINLTKLSIDKVTALIDAIETSRFGDLIKVTKLKVSKRFDEPDLLDLQMTISTWKSA